MLVAILLVLSPAAAFAQDNTSVEINQKDGSTEFDFSFSIVRSMADIVDEVNAAVAVASCDNCKTYAVAIQVVLVMNDPSVVEPTNLALAMNIDCTSCQTAALAYQLVQSTGGVVRLSPEAEQEIAELRKEMHDLAKAAEDMTFEEVIAAVDELAAEFMTVVTEGLVAVGPDEDDDEETATPSPETSVTPEPSVSADPSVTPTPAETTPEPTDTPTPAASTSP